MESLPRIATPRTPVTSRYHSVDVTEDYRWLEDPADRQVVAWTAAQNRRTREYLDALAFGPALRARVRQVLAAGGVSYRSVLRGGSMYFALKGRPPKQQPFIVALSDLADTAGERVVVDPNVIDPSGQTSIGLFVPSPNGALLAVSLAQRGSEDGTIYVYEVASGEVVDAPIAHANPAAAVASLAWRHDVSGFWYSRADDAGFHQQVWVHELGSAGDVPDLGGVFADPVVVENFLTASDDGRWVMDRVQKGDGGQWQIFVRRQPSADGARDEAAEAGWWQVADIADKCVDAVFGRDALFLLSHAGSGNGSVLQVDLTPGATVADAEQVVAPGDHALTGLAVTESILWVTEIDGGPCGLRVFGLDGSPRPAVEVPPVSTVSGLRGVADDRAVWAVESFTTPTVWWTGTDRDRGSEAELTALATTTSVDLSGYEVTREFAISRDGTRVPISVIAAPGTPRDGSALTLLTGYGGYGISLTPSFDASRLVWLEQGGVYAVANIRGGEEYGAQWREQGRLAVKQHCFDDFIACADHLVHCGITSRERLAIRGGSNGGLLMGAVLTQRPDLARAVVAEVPVMDMLRVETTRNGRYNISEYGTVEDPKLFSALLAYSPYHNVADGTPYPAVLLTGGEFDPRVDAWHPKKMAARLQAATASDEPVLLRIEPGGHGIGRSLDQSVDLLTDCYAFLFDRLGGEYRSSPTSSDETMHQ